MNIHDLPETYKRGKISGLAIQLRSDSRREKTSPQECIESSIYYYIISYYSISYCIRVGVQLGVERYRPGDRYLLLVQARATSRQSTVNYC